MLSVTLSLNSFPRMGLWNSAFLNAGSANQNVPSVATSRGAHQERFALNMLHLTFGLIFT